MIQSSPKPSKTIMIGEVTIQLDREYRLEVEKTICENTATDHKANLLEPTDVEPSVKKLVEDTVVGHLQRNGIW